MGTNARAPKDTSRQRLLEALRFRGLFSRVAKALGVTRQHVGRVARGERNSRRVEEALTREIRKLERRAA